MFVSGYHIVYHLLSNVSLCKVKKKRQFSFRFFKLYFFIARLPHWIPDLSLNWAVPRKRHKIWQALRLPYVPFPWSLAVHHQSLEFSDSPYHAKNEGPEEETDLA